MDPGQVPNAIRNFVGWVLEILAAFAFLPIGSDAIEIAKHGAKRIRRLDEKDVEPKEVAKSSGATTGSILALFVAILLIELIVKPNSWLLRLVVALINLFLGFFGVPPIVL